MQFTGAVLDCFFRTDLDTGATFEALVDVDRGGFARLQLVNFSGTRIHTVCVAFAFLVVYLYGYRITLPDVFGHFHILLTLIVSNLNRAF
jgi:hypothetical protein